MTKNKWVWSGIILLISIAFYFLLRIPNLNIIPVFVDEAIYVRWSQVMRSESSLRFLPMSDGKQPLFMWATIPFFKFIDDPLLAARTLSVFTGLGSLVGSAFLAFLLFGNPVIAALTAMIYSLLPFTVFFDRMALADSMLAMFGVWTLGLSVLFVKTLRLDHAMFLGFVLGGGLLTKSPAIIFYSWLLVAVVVFFRAKDGLWKSLGSLLIGLFFAVIISQAIYSVLRLGPNFQMLGARNQDYLYTWKEVLGHPLSPFVGNIKSTINWLWLLLTPSSFVLFFLGWINKKDRRQFIFLSIAALLPLVSQATIAKVYTSRYILFATYPIIPILALGLFWLIRRKGVLLKISSVVLLLVPFVISILYVTKPENAPLSHDMRNGYLEEWTAGTGQKEVSDYLVDLAKKGQKVVVFTEGFFGTLPDGIQIYTQTYPNITVVGSTYFVTTIPEGLVNTSPDNQRFFILNKSRNHLGQADLSKLELIKEYPKAVRTDGTREALQFYRYISNN